MKKFIGLDPTYVEKIGTGKVISIIQKGIDQWAYSLEDILHNGTRILITFVYLIVTFRSVGYSYMIGFLIIICLCLFFAWFCNQKVIVARRERINANHGYSRQLVKMIMAKNEILQSERTKEEISNLDFYKDENIRYNRMTNPWMHRLFFLPRLFFDIGRIILFGYVGWVVISSGGGVSEIVLLGGGLVFLDQTIDKTIGFYKDLTKNFDYVWKMREFFEEGKNDIDYNEGENFVYEGGSIVFGDIGFGYNEMKVLDGLNLTIQGKKKTALVGPSGAGKSTIVKLIAGYIRPDSGSIIIDGQDLSEVSLKSYYKHIGYLTQEPSVFDGTIRENLTYASSTSSEGQIDEAINLSKCDFIYEFADGLDTEIGERGIRLSGGQRQRLAIAKIFLKDPEIIILDEPTSALDSFSEEAITEAMNELFKNRTVIIIAHRLQTVKHADDIILLDQGEVVERGTHDELVGLGGQYAKMLELQSGF